MGSKTYQLRSCQRMVETMQGKINTLIDRLMDAEGEAEIYGHMMPSDWAENVRDQLHDLHCAIESEIKIVRDARGSHKRTP